MKPRVFAVAGIALILILAGSLTSVQAYQASQADQARMRYEGALNQIDASLARAQAEGVTAAELRAVSERRSRLVARPAPASWAFFHPGLAAFYGRQERAVLGLEPALAARVRQVTQERKAAADHALHTLEAAIATARSLDVGTSGASMALASQRAAYARAALPREYAAVTSKALATGTAVVRGYRAEQQYVQQELSGHSSVSSIRRRASLEAQAAESRLPLLGLLTSRVDTYRRELSSATAAVNAAQSAFGAAVKESHVRTLAATVAADYAQTVPDKMIVVSTENQDARVYQNGKVVLTTPVTTGGPELPTDHGVFHIYEKISPFVFHSPWPRSSPYYYLPSPVQYWMPFDGGEGLHDAPWRSNFGPGSNLQPTDLGTGNYILGTHGCVNLPTSAATFIWNWAPLGTTVVVI